MAGISISAHNNEYKSGTTLGYHCISSDYEASEPHSHDFHEMLCFFGGDPENVNELGAEISICLGDEHEEYLTSEAVIISIPPGLTHCPLKVTKITKPVVFLEISDTTGYSSSNDNSGTDTLSNRLEASGNCRVEKR